MTAEQTIAIRRLVEDAVRAVATANESARYQAQLAELEAAVAHAEMAAGGGHHGMDGGGEAVPGNFEPEFADDNGTMKLDSVGEGYWPFGRQFSNAVSVDSSAKIAEGLIYLEITHPVPSSGSASDPSAVIKGVGPSETPPSFWNTNANKSLIPLYRIKDGAMTRDFRSCMSLTMREL